MNSLVPFIRYEFVIYIKTFCRNVIYEVMIFQVLQQLVVQIWKVLCFLIPESQQNNFQGITVEPVYNGHPRDLSNWPLNTGGRLIQDH